MKCRACGFEDDNAREEDAFLRVNGDFKATFPQHESKDIEDVVFIYACPRCGTLRIESWRLREDRIGS